MHIGKLRAVQEVALCFVAVFSLFFLSCVSTKESGGLATEDQVSSRPCRWADEGSGDPGCGSALASFSFVSLCNLSHVSPSAFAK